MNGLAHVFHLDFLCPLGPIGWDTYGACLTRRCRLSFRLTECRRTTQAVENHSNRSSRTRSIQRARKNSATQVTTTQVQHREKTHHCAAWPLTNRCRQQQLRLPTVRGIASHHEKTKLQATVMWTGPPTQANSHRSHCREPPQRNHHYNRCEQLAKGVMKPCETTMTGNLCDINIALHRTSDGYQTNQTRRISPPVIGRLISK